MRVSLLNHTVPEEGKCKACLLLSLLEYRGVMPLAARHVAQRLLRELLGSRQYGRLAAELGQLSEGVWRGKGALKVNFFLSI